MIKKWRLLQRKKKVLWRVPFLVIFYGSNSWSYTRLGKIDDLSGWEEALGSGDEILSQEDSMDAFRNSL